MYSPIRFPDEVETLVRFIEETDPDRIIGETVEKLRGGVSAREMLRAAALAVVRSTELPAVHHGGAVHPICGLHGCYGTSQRLPGEMAFLPVVQHVALCNHHIQSRHMGPYIMPALEPMDGSVDSPYEIYKDRESSIVHLGGKSDNGSNGDALEMTKTAFLNNINSHRPVAAEQLYLWLAERQSPGEVMDLLLPGFITRNYRDDHNILYPVFTARALDDIGWEWAPVLMRPIVRYQARSGGDLSGGETSGFKAVEDVVEEFGLLDMDIPFHTTEDETDTIRDLGEAIGANRTFFDNIEMMGRALVEGLSLEGTGEALSIGTSMIFSSTNYGNPMDSHPHTGVNTRRYIIQMEGVSVKNKLLALLTGLTGPECTISERKMVWPPRTDPDVLAGLPHRSQSDLLTAIVETVEDQPPADWRNTAELDNVVAPDEVQHTKALAEQYMDSGYEPSELIIRLGELICRDDFTELHAVKQHQAIIDEYNTTRESLRSIHLVAAAKSAAVVHAGREQRVYTEFLQQSKVA